MTNPPRTILAIAAALLVVIMGTLGLWMYVGRTGETRIERWVGQYLRSVVNAHITAELAFDGLDYQAPRGVVVRGLTLQSDGVAILSVDRAALELAEIPRVGEPILIQHVELERPRLRFMRTAGAGFVGWGGLVRQDVTEDYARVTAGRRASDFLRLRLVEIRDAGFSYVGSAGGPPMEVEGFDAQLASPPADEPGLYDLSGQATWHAVLRISLKAALNIDTAVLSVHELGIAGNLGEESYGLLPPRLQDLARKHGLETHVDARLAGTLPLWDALAAEMVFKARLKNTGLRLEQYVVRLDNADTDLALRERRLTGEAHLRMMDGDARLDGSLLLADAHPFRINARCDGVELERMFESQDAVQTRLAGKLSGTVEVSGEGLALPQTLRGRGALEIRDGYLVNLPLVERVYRLVLGNRALPEWARKDRASVEFSVQPDHLEILESDVVTTLLAARATGRVNYDRTLELRVAAGPMQRVAAMLGPVGEKIAGLTERLIAYRVSGRLGDPQVEIDPLGLRGGP